MRIMTFNIQHCALHLEEKRISFPPFGDFIRESGARIVGLNEVRGRGSREDYQAQTEALSKESGMAHSFFAPAIMVGGSNPYGNAILSSSPFVSLENIPIPDPSPRRFSDYYESRCILKAVTHDGLTVLVTHFGLNADEAESAVKTVLEHIEDSRCVLMGDFNLTPDSPILDPIRERMTDTAAFSPEPLLSFPSHAPDRKIDYIFVSRDIKVRSAGVSDKVISDHLAYTVDIEI